MNLTQCSIADYIAMRPVSVCSSSFTTTKTSVKIRWEREPEGKAVRQHLYLSDWAEADRLTSPTWALRRTCRRESFVVNIHGHNTVPGGNTRNNIYRKVEWQLQALCWPGLSKSLQLLWHAVGDPMATTSHSPWKHAALLRSQLTPPYLPGPSATQHHCHFCLHGIPIRNSYDERQHNYPFILQCPAPGHQLAFSYRECDPWRGHVPACLTGEHL